MRYRMLGTTGVQVSRLGLGAMVLGAWGNTDRADCVGIIRRALDSGINLVDTADVYADGENEEIVGEALAGRRDDVVLCTKFHHPLGDHGEPNRRGSARRWIVRAVDDSLRRLRTDRIDVYQAHRPDPTVDLEETIATLDDLVRAGKILLWGTSTHPAELLVEAQWTAARRGLARPRVEQPPYSILCRGIERDVLAVCDRYGVGVLAWSPLSGGWLTGKYTSDDLAPHGSRAATNPAHFDGANPDKLAAVEALRRVAADAGMSMVQVALGFVTAHPAVSAALIGPRTGDQLDALLAAADIDIDDDVLDQIDAIVEPGRDLNPADRGWDPPGLALAHRRRTTS